MANVVVDECGSCGRDEKSTASTEKKPQKDLTVPLSVQLLSNKKTMKQCGRVAGKLESLCYDRRNGNISVFKTSDAHSLFAKCLLDIADTYDISEARGFDINEWFESVQHTLEESPGEIEHDYDLDPNGTMQAVSSQWLVALFEAEQKIPHFITLLDGAFEYEDQLYITLKETRKTVQYAQVYDSCKLLLPSTSSTGLLKSTAENPFAALIKKPRSK